MSDPPSDWDSMVSLLAVAAAVPEPRRGALAALGRLVFGSSAARLNERTEAELVRLGLATVERPAERLRAGSRVPEQVGPTVVRGTRHGRSVEIRMDPGRYRVTLGGFAAPEFHVRSENGLLRASARSPAVVREALEGLSQHARWKGAEAKGDGEGVKVFHEVAPGGWGGAAGAYYLDDLWLAERLAEAVADAGPGPVAAEPPPS